MTDGNTQAIAQYLDEREDWDALQEVTAELEQAEARIEELEAKLAKAVEDLERIGSGEFSGQMLTSMPPQDAAAYFARATIAELQGETGG